MVERCELTELPVDGCAHCRPTAPLPAAAAPGAWTTARYPGECSGCWDEIRPGSRIRADGTGGWLCTDCGEAEDD